MKKIAAQFTPDYNLVPYSLVDKDEVRAYKPYQIVDITIKGTRKERSYKQLKMYFGCCEVVASNTNDHEWNTRKKADFRTRLGCSHFDQVIVQGEKVFFSVGRINYDNCEHLEANGFFTDAFQLLANKIKVTIDVLKQMYVEQSS